jgi:nicotinate-nucleotide adenylyltransferase
MSGEKIGIGGGVFDPVHIGHLFLFNECADSLNLQRVLLIPTFRAVHKVTDAISEYSHRCEMVRIVCDENERFELCEVEKELGGPSYTLDTIRTLKDRYHDADWYFIVGLDNLEKMEEWHEPDEIFKEAHIVVGSRPLEAEPVDPKYRDRVIHLDMPELDISSTDIRERCRSGRSIKYLVPSRIEQYISKHKLYMK